MRWRFLAHRADGDLELENEGAFDELVVDDWLHLEKMDENVWWCRMGDARLTITLRSGQPPVLDVTRGEYAEACGQTSKRETD
jgi:hypothetical protein